MQKSWKGGSEKETSVVTGSDDGNCGFPFVLGETYLVYASGTDYLYTGSCGRNNLLANAYEDLNSLGTGEKIQDNNTTSKDFLHSNPIKSLVAIQTINISNTGMAFEPRMLDLGSNVYVVWGDSDGTRFTKSTDNGITFSTPIKISDAKSSYKMAVYKDNVYVIMGSGLDVYLVKSTDGGKTFGMPVNVSKTRIDSPAANIGDYQIAVSDNNVYVAWRISNYNWSEIYFAKSNDGGNSFSESKNVSNNSEASQMVLLTASENSVYLVWNDHFYNSAGPSLDYISFAKSNDYGNTFQSTTNFSNNSYPNGNSYEPQLFADKNAVYVSWRDEADSHAIVLAKSTDGGNNFERTFVTRSGAYPAMSVFQNDVYIAWWDDKYGSATPNAFFSKSNDGGKTFSEPIALSNNTEPLSPYAQRPFPQLVSYENNVYVLWKYDTDPTQTWLAKSNNGGESFEKIDLSTNIHHDEFRQLEIFAGIVYILHQSYDTSDVLLTKLIDTNATKIIDDGAENTVVDYANPISEYSNYIIPIGMVISGIIIAIIILRLRKKK